MTKYDEFYYEQQEKRANAALKREQSMQKIRGHNAPRVARLQKAVTHAVAKLTEIRGGK